VNSHNQTVPEILVHGLLGVVHNRYLQLHEVAGERAFVRLERQRGARVLVARSHLVAGFQRGLRTGRDYIRGVVACAVAAKVRELRLPRIPRRVGRVGLQLYEDLVHQAVLLAQHARPVARGDVNLAEVDHAALRSGHGLEVAARLERRPHLIRSALRRDVGREREVRSAYALVPELLLAQAAVVDRLVGGEVYLIGHPASHAVEQFGGLARVLDRRVAVQAHEDGVLIMV